MARAARYIAAIGILALLFMVLSERYSPVFFLYGTLISVFALFFTRWLLPGQSLSGYSRIHVLSLALYLPCLVFFMVEAAVKSIALITKRAKTITYEFPTRLPDAFRINLLANSITLTPGTVCVEHRGDRLLVMQLVAPGEKQDYSRITQMEKLISKI